MRNPAADPESETGGYCPEVFHAPQTAEGAAVLEVLEGNGVWKRAGTNGVPTGLDMTEALARLPAGVDAETGRALFLAAEGPWLAAVYERLEAEKTEA